MKNLKSIQAILLIFLSIYGHMVYGDCDVVTAYKTGINIVSNVQNDILKYNKYETVSNINTGELTESSEKKLVYDTVFGDCGGKYRNVYAITSLDESNRIVGTSIYKISKDSPFAIQLEIGDSPEKSVYSPVNSVETPLLTSAWNGYTSGIKMKFKLYLIKDNLQKETAKSINDLQVGKVYMKDTSGLKIGTEVPIKLTAYLTKEEHTCALTQPSYSLALEDVSLRQLPTVGEDSTLAPKTLNLSINCPYLKNGGSREVNAYITDSYDPSNATSILTNKEGSGFATGVGVRLRDKNSEAINLDPNESKNTNKWTFGYLATEQTINHVIRANYVRTENRVVAGNVEAKALLNIVYD